MTTLAALAVGIALGWLAAKAHGALSNHWPALRDDASSDADTEESGW